MIYFSLVAFKILFLSLQKQMCESAFAFSIFIMCRLLYHQGIKVLSKILVINLVVIQICDLCLFGV